MEKLNITDETDDEKNKADKQELKEQIKRDKKMRKQAAKQLAKGEQNQTTNTIMPVSLTPPSGTRDFYPEEYRVRSWLFGKWRESARAFGFEEYDAPVLESEALYVRKSGEEAPAFVGFLTILVHRMRR